MAAPDNDRILIAGAGPTGLAAALRLAQLGVPVAVFERRPALARLSRAATFHPPALDVLDRLGVLEGALRTGVRVEVLQHWRAPAGDAPCAEFALAALAADTAYPFRIHIEQADVALAMAARLAGFPHARLVPDSEVVDIEHRLRGISVAIRAADSVRVEQGALLLAADGAQSAVRDAAGIAFEGTDLGHRVLRVTTERDLAAVLPGLGPAAHLHDGEEACTVLRLAEAWRLIFRVPAAESDAEALDPARIRDRVRRFLGTDDVPVLHRDVHMVMRRVAARFRQGRVLLAGDAAHATDTHGGLNMNCGLHDAMQAAAALAEARAFPHAADAVLDRYAATRRAVAFDHLLPRTRQPGGEASLDRLRAMAADPAAARAHLRHLAMLDVETPRPPAVLTA